MRRTHTRYYGFGLGEQRTTQRRPILVLDSLLLKKGHDIALAAGNVVASHTAFKLGKVWISLAQMSKPREAEV